MAECGAKKRRSNELCKAKAMQNGRCRLHGGATPKGKRSPNITPGSIYSKFLTEEEQALEATLELGNVDAELKLMRLRLRRALDDELAGGKKDYHTIINVITSRIESLEARRLSLVTQALDNDLKAGAVEDRKNGVKDDSGTTIVVVGGLPSE